MLKKTKYMDKGLQTIYVSALRYALESRSCLSGVIIDEITKVMERLNEFSLPKMAAYIRFYVENNLVDDCWVKKWTECANRLDSCSVEKIKKEMKK